MVFAQNDALKTVFVAKDFVIKTIPHNADVIAINSNGGEQKVGNDSAALHADKGEVYTIEVRKEGFQSVRKLYTRQKDGVEEDIVELPNRILRLSAIPIESSIFVDNIGIGSSHDIYIPKDKSVSVEAKYPGFVTQSKVFYNVPGQEEPGISYQFKLEDRFVEIKASPADASILVDGKSKGIGKADVVIKKNSCVKVSVEHPGYVSKTVSFCNKDNETEPPLSQEIQLRDRSAQFIVQPDNASISVDGKEVGKGTYEVKIPDGKCVEVFIHADGFAPIQQNLCNRQDGVQPDSVYTIKMVDDEAFTQSEQSGVANGIFGVEVNPDTDPIEAWKKLCSIIQTYFDEIESQDATTSYLKTNWVASIPFNLTSPFPRIIRTRVVVTSGGSNPLKYNIKIQSEISRMGKDCKPEGMKYPPVNRDDCFDPFSRIFRKYKDLITEVQARLK
jgi:hypothetical protein